MVATGQDDPRSDSPRAEPGPDDSQVDDARADDSRADDSRAGDSGDPHAGPTLAIPRSEAPAESSAERLRPGQQFGRYRIVRLLGAGGMGEVYEAEDGELHRRVALKTLRSRLTAETDRRRFLREGRLAASLSHPNSVYIYGTEKIEGRLAISMELVDGGTLQDHVDEEGPLEPAEAVDAILQVISGLDAAEAKGILHRDVKPSNCFVTERGAVKVGDFGLSLPVEATDETQLTMTHTLLGTPAFASPEQLQGEDLDRRADIYSVGATLYWLLTGETPFQAGNIAKLIASVAHEPAPSPRQAREDIPAGLAKVVSRCLEKRPDKRPGSYAELAAALAPFASARPDAAALGRRFGAFLFDLAAWFSGSVALVRLAMGDVEGALTALELAAVLTSAIVYFGLCEGIWGATPGKYLAGLRVRSSSGGDATPVRALARASIFALFFLAGDAFDVLSGSNAAATEPTFDAYSLIELAIPLLLFVTARRGNGWAGIHELLSGTGVVSAGQDQGVRRPLEPAEAKAPEPIDEPPASTPAGSGLERLGPYRIVATLRVGEDERLLAGNDPRLDRHVWLHLQAPGTTAVPEGRRGLDRISRLRWINGARGDELAWDAYEAPEGKALLELSEPLEWETVRHLLLDIATEIDAAADADEPLPPLALDRIWVTNAGRVKVLDFPAPGATGPLPPGGEQALGSEERHRTLDGSDVGSLQRFLYRVASAARGSPAPVDLAEEADPRPANSPRYGDERPGQPSRPLPLHATELLTAFRKRRLGSHAELVERLRAVTSLPCRVTLPRRFVGIGALAFLPVMASLAMDAGAAIAFLIVAAVFTLIFSLAFREGPMLRLSRLALVDGDGSRVSRLRSGGRALIVFSPVIVWLVVGLWLAPPHLAELLDRTVGRGAVYATGYEVGFQVGHQFGRIRDVFGAWPGYLALAMMVAGATWSMIDRHRGPQDHIAGTRVVRR